MEPTWTSDCGTVNLWLGDCLDVMATWPDGAVDAVVTSPPYNMIPKTRPSGILAEFRHKKTESYATYSDEMNQDAYESWVRRVVGESIRTCGGLVWVNHKVRFIDKFARHPVRFLPWEIHQEIIWSRPGSTTLNANRYAPSHEVILAFGSPVYWDRCNDTKLTVWSIPPERNVKDHPCPFPETIPARLIESSSRIRSIVADPFMGSGTTGVAAVRLGRSFWGVELDPGYFETAKRRIQDELKRVAFLEGEHSKPEQRMLID